MDQLQADFKERMEKMEKSLTDKLNSLPQGAPTEERTTIARAVEEIKAWKTSEKDVAEAFGVKEVVATPEMNIKAALEEAKKLGYEIKAPRTIDDIEKTVKEQVELARKVAIEQTTKKLASDDKKMALLVSLGQAALDGLLPALTAGTGVGAAETLEAAKNALKSIRPQT